MTLSTRTKTASNALRALGRLLPALVFANCLGPQTHRRDAPRLDFHARGSSLKAWKRFADGLNRPSRSGNHHRTPSPRIWMPTHPHPCPQRSRSPPRVHGNIGATSPRLSMACSEAIPKSPASIYAAHKSLWPSSGAPRHPVRRPKIHHYLLGASIAERALVESLRG
jgi:hypothetical protein